MGMERAERAALNIFVAGIGVTMLASAGPLAFPDAPRLLWQIIFCVGAAIAILPVIFLAAEYRQFTKARRMVPLIGMIISGACFLGFSGWYFWPHTNKTESPTQAEAAPNQKPWKHTLEDLFKSDFAQYGNVQRVISARAQNNTNGYDVTFEIPFRVYPDFTSHTTFVALYVPNQSDARFDAYATIQWLRDQVRPTLEAVRTSIGWGASAPGMPYQELKDLTFSGRIFIYLMTPFTVIQLGELTAFYQESGMYLEIRGNDYWWANKDR
jgi:hypothetical protein